jgi:general secretion pathway protein N
MPQPHHPPLQRAPWRWALLGAAVGAVLAVLAGAPAHWLSAGVGLATGQRVQLQAERGTVWSGSATLTLTGGAGSNDRSSLPGRIHWRWGLAWPALGLQLSADCCTPQPLQWTLRLRSPEQGPGLALQLQDQQSSWPMGVLAGLGAPWNTLQAQGQLQWQSTGLRLQWRQNTLLWQGATELQVLKLSSRLSTLRPMGSYRIALQSAPLGTASPELTLRTLQGPLQLKGQGLWTGQRLRFVGEATAEEGSQAALSNLLNIIGRRDGARSLLSLG